MKITRRVMIKASVAVGVMLASFPWLRNKNPFSVNRDLYAKSHSLTDGQLALGTDVDGFSRVFVARNGTPEQNIQKTLDMMGGIGNFVSPTDIVVLKPNAQWWNQGMTNTDSMKAFIDIVLRIPDFSGEIIIAENHQYNESDSRGWSTDQRNGKFNFNELVQHYQRAGYANVTKYHWQVAGTAAVPLQGDAQGNSRITGPEQGDGYVWMDDCYYQSPAGKKCLMTYPVFTSSYSGITVDLKNGAWKDGDYLEDRKVRFINFSALNHHGWYCGVTASVKNFMGVVDMTCGFPGDKPEGMYNTHYIGIDKKILWTRKRGVWRLGSLVDRFVEYCHRDFYHTGGALGYFMQTVRMPDLNIITAEWVGWGDRIDTKRAFRPKTILASRDPVGLDYVAARDVLLPETPTDRTKKIRSDLRYYDLNNPDNYDGPFWRFLNETHKQGIGNLDEKKIKTVMHDFKSGPLLKLEKMGNNHGK